VCADNAMHFRSPFRCLSEIYQRVVVATKKQAETEKQQSMTEPVVREMEIIREVIYKVKCPYCGKLYNEVLDVCPHCGRKR
jgi:hypothetical protein